MSHLSHQDLVHGVTVGQFPKALISRQLETVPHLSHLSHRKNDSRSLTNLDLAYARVGATNPTAGSGVNPKDPSWCSVLLRQVGGATARKGAGRHEQLSLAYATWPCCAPQEVSYVPSIPFRAGAVLWVTQSASPCGASGRVHPSPRGRVVLAPRRRHRRGSTGDTRRHPTDPRAGV